MDSKYVAVGSFSIPNEELSLSLAFLPSEEFLEFWIFFQHMARLLGRGGRAGIRINILL